MMICLAWNSWSEESRFRFGIDRLRRRGTCAAARCAGGNRWIVRRGRRAAGAPNTVSFRQGCVKPPESRFLLSEEAADGGSADLKLACDFGFADSLPV